MTITTEKSKTFVVRYQQNDKIYVLDIEAKSSNEADAILESIKAIRQYQPIER